ETVPKVPLTDVMVLELWCSSGSRPGSAAARRARLLANRCSLPTCRLFPRCFARHLLSNCGSDLLRHLSHFLHTRRRRSLRHRTSSLRCAARDRSTHSEISDSSSLPMRASTGSQPPCTSKHAFLSVLERIGGSDRRTLQTPPNVP